MSRPVRTLAEIVKSAGIDVADAREALAELERRMLAERVKVPGSDVTRWRATDWAWTHRRLRDAA